MKHRDDDLSQALCDIANRKGDIAKIAPSVCLRAMHRITELENAWAKIRDEGQKMIEVIERPDADDLR